MQITHFVVNVLTFQFLFLLRLCPRGIVNAVKFNIRAESPRDYADMLLSFKHLPNVVIYDFARG